MPPVTSLIVFFQRRTSYSYRVIRLCLRFHVPSTSWAETARCIRTALAGFKRYFQGSLEAFNCCDLLVGFAPTRISILRDNAHYCIAGVPLRVPHFPGVQLTYSIPNAVVFGGDSVDPQTTGPWVYSILPALYSANGCLPTGFEPVPIPVTDGRSLLGCCP